MPKVELTELKNDLSNKPGHKALKPVATNLFSFFSNIDFAQAAQVSRDWKEMAEHSQNQLAIMTNQLEEQYARALKNWHRSNLLPKTKNLLDDQMLSILNIKHPSNKLPINPSGIKMITGILTQFNEAVLLVNKDELSNLSAKLGTDIANIACDTQYSPSVFGDQSLNNEKYRHGLVNKSHPKERSPKR